MQLARYLSRIKIMDGVELDGKATPCNLAEVSREINLNGSRHEDVLDLSVF